MKRVFLFLASVGILAACSGFNDDINEENGDDADIKEVIFTVQPIVDGDILTKASAIPQPDKTVAFAWEANDTVGIFPNTGSQVYFTMGSEAGSSSAHFDGGGWALRQDSSYVSYYPLVGEFYLDRRTIPVSFAGQKQIGTTSPFRGARYFLATPPAKSVNGVLTFSYKTLNTIINVNATLPAGTYTKMSLNISDPLFVEEGTCDLDDLRIVGKKFSNTLEIELEDIVLTEPGTVPVYIMSAPVDLKDKEVSVLFTTADGGKYVCTKNVTRTYLAGTRYGLTCDDFKDDADDDPTLYAKASSITVGGTYLIVDAEDKRLFKGSVDGKYVDVSPQDNVITDTDGSLTGYEFTVENSGSNYYLKYNDGKYLICDYTDNGSAGLDYVNSQSDVPYPYALTTGNNGAFFFSTTQKNDPTLTDQVLYYKAPSGSNSDIFKIGGTGRTIGVHLYLKDGIPEPVKQDRGLSFDPESVTCTLGDTPQKPVLSGIYTTVAYSSSDDKIATVDPDGNVTPVAAGIVTITATVEEDEQYNAGSASYTLKIKRVSASGTYSLVTSIDQVVMGSEYVIAYDDGSTQKAFKPILNAGKNAFLTSDNAVDILIIDDEIDAAEVDACRFTLTNQDGTKYKFSLVVPEADGTSDYYWYVYRSGVFAAMKDDDSADKGYRSTFSLSSDGKLTLTGNSSNVFRYSSGNFTAGSGTSSNLYLFVRTGGPAKQKQTLSFDEQIVTWMLGDDFEVGQSYSFQKVKGAQTTITYSSEPESVAKIENDRIRIVGSGSATITATAEKTDKFYGASASYTLRINKAPSQEWVDMGTFSLENQAFSDYLDEANRSYTDTNDSDFTVMDKYSGRNYSSIERKDCPNPVTVKWTYSTASKSTVVSIYDTEALDNQVWTQNATEGATSAEVYNLIPGRKYYYTVSENGSVWEKGYFSTTGRRRMIKVSDIEAKGRANNCRDLGGLEVNDNGTKKSIKYELLYRGSCLDATTDSEKDFMVGFMNIGLDVDLRDSNSSTPGQGNNGNSVCYQAFGANYDVKYNSQKFASGQTIADLTTPEKVYNVLTDIFATVKSGKSVYFHCHIGADRTGYMAMLIEGLLGVSEKDCSIDYELTSFSDAAGQRFRNGEPVWYTFRDGIKYLRDLPGTTFQNKIENYLVKTVGISQDQIDEFKSIVLN